MKNLENRIADLEVKAGVGMNYPKVLITFVDGWGSDEDLQHAYTNCGGERKEIHRQPRESIEAFKLRAKELDGIVWMTP